MPPSPRCQGFTLLEMAIVLSIVALLIGAVLGGRNLIQSAELRSTVSQISSLNQSVGIFYDQYTALPGDATNATKVWPFDAATQPVTNGNGNGRIETNGDCIADGFTFDDEPDCGQFTGERSQFFYQLGLAGLAESYASALTATPVGNNVPAIKMYPAAGILVTGRWTEPSPTSNTNTETYAKGKVYLYLGVCNPGALGVDNTYNDCEIFTGAEIWDIDKKIDDGKPLSGKIIGQSSVANCVTGEEYDLSGETRRCNALYKLK